MEEFFSQRVSPIHTAITVPWIAENVTLVMLVTQWRDSASKDARRVIAEAVVTKVKEESWFNSVEYLLTFFFYLNEPSAHN